MFASSYKIYFCMGLSSCFTLLLCLFSVWYSYDALITMKKETGTVLKKALLEPEVYILIVISYFSYIY